MNFESILFFALCALSAVSCEEKSMSHKVVFPPVVDTIPFSQGEVSYVFGSSRESSLGVVMGDTWSIITVEEDDVTIDEFPESQFSCPTCRALFPMKGNLLFVRSSKSVALLDWNAKDLLGEYMNLSKSMYTSVQTAKPIGFRDGVVFTAFRYNIDLSTTHYFLAIDDVVKGKRIKELPIPDARRSFPIYFTRDHTFLRPNYEVPWRALNNTLDETRHPLVGLLNAGGKEYAVVSDNMVVSEEQKHALIISYNRAMDKDMLFLASWYDEPKVTPIITDSSLIAGGRRLVKTPNQNTISPSGNWAYFSTDGGRLLPDTHHIIYLDGSVPGGYLGPWKLELTGNIDCASWMMGPEALVLCKEGKLVRFDLSGFDPQQYISADG